MKTLSYIVEECMEELDNAEIPYGEVTNVKINYTAKRRFGRCSKNKYGSGYTIEVSVMLLEDYVPDDSLKTVLLHEFIHTCPMCFDHGSIWKKYADKMNRMYGYSISRTNSYDELGLTPPKDDTQVKHEVMCTQCGLTYKRSRSCNLVRETWRYRCGECGGELELLY